MKKSTKFIIALLVTVGALAITYRVVNQAPSKDLAADAQMQEIITSGGMFTMSFGQSGPSFLCQLARCKRNGTERRNARLSCFRHDRNG